MESFKTKSLLIQLPTSVAVKDLTVINPNQLESLKLIEDCLNQNIPVLISNDDGKVIARLVKENDEYITYSVAKI